MKTMGHALFALALAVAAFAFQGTRAEAATIAPGALAAASESGIVHQVQARCLFASAQCRARFGTGPDYRRCMRRRGCGAGADRPRRCNAVERQCRRSFGRGSDFRRCMRRRGC